MLFITVLYVIPGLFPIFRRLRLRIFVLVLDNLLYTHNLFVGSHVLRVFPADILLVLAFRVVRSFDLGLHLSWWNFIRAFLLGLL